MRQTIHLTIMRLYLYIHGLKTQFGAIFDYFTEISSPVAQVYCSKFDDDKFEALIRLQEPLDHKSLNGLRIAFPHCIFR